MPPNKARKGHGKVTRRKTSPIKKRGQLVGPHKTWAKFVRDVLAEMPWTREETCEFLEIKIGWLKKALRGGNFRGDFRESFQDRLSAKWKENFPDKKELKWPSYLDDASWDKVAGSAQRSQTSALPNIANNADVRIAPSHLSAGENIGGNLLVGRDRERADLDAAWNGPRRKNVVIIVALLGAGKTSLVSRWANDTLAKKNHCGIKRYFAWSFYNQGTGRKGDADLFLKEALVFFGDPVLAASNVGAWKKGERLYELIVNYRSLLILDGLEPLQDEKTGELRDDGLNALVRGLAAHNPGLCLITTRRHLSEFTTHSHTNAPVWELSPLSSRAGADLLTALGVEGAGARRRHLSAHVKGHALTLVLLGSYLREAHKGDIRRVDRVNFQKADERIAGGHAFRIMAAYEKWFTKTKWYAELNLLRLLGLFDRPASPDCIAALCDPPIAELTETLAAADIETWNQALYRLVKLNLIEQKPSEFRQVFGYNKNDAKSSKLGKPKAFTSPGLECELRSSIDTHPLIRAYFAKHLQTRATSAWISANTRLFDHLRFSVPDWPEGLDGLQRLFQSIVHGCAAGSAEDALWKVYDERIQRGDRRYALKQVGALSSTLAALAYFYKNPWTILVEGLEPSSQRLVYNETAVHLRASGRLQEAIVPSELACEKSGETDCVNAAVNFGNHAELLLSLGYLSQAAMAADRAVGYSDKGKDEEEKMYQRTVRAEISFCTGDFDESNQLLLEAQTIQKSREPEFPELYSVPGFRQHCLLLAPLESSVWRLILGIPGNSTSDVIRMASNVTIMANNALKSAKVKGWMFGIALHHLTIGEALLFQRIVDVDSKPPSHAENAALFHLAWAVRLSRRGGVYSHLVRSLRSRSWAYFQKNCIREANADLDNAQQIAERGPMRLHLADIHLHRARFFRDKTELRRARILIKQLRYGRRKQELEDAETASKQW